MKIKKIGHCCLAIEVNGKKIITDPGSYTVSAQEKEKNIDIIIISHEHGDHLHVKSLKKVLQNNPDAKIITNQGVGQILDEKNISYQVLEDKKATNISEILLEAHDCKHAEIFEEIGQVQNTGYFIGERLFYPGDAFYNPGKPVEILALPVAGPWSKVRDSMDYVLEIKPKACFPVHDGMLEPGNFGGTHKVPAKILPTHGILFKSFEENNEEEF